MTCDVHVRIQPSYSSQKSCVKIWFGLVEPFKGYRGKNNVRTFRLYNKKKICSVRRHNAFSTHSTYLRSRYNSIMVQDIEKCYITKKLRILICNNFCLEKKFVQHIFKALFTKKCDQKVFAPEVAYYDL